MIHRSADSNGFEFVRVASLRAAQLMRGCSPRVTPSHKSILTAQMEVVAGKVFADVRVNGEPAPVIAKEDACVHAKEMLSDLYRLIEALDRRVPRLERLGEAQIAHDAADLRERALSLIHRIEGNAPME